ncbi:unnamed protein product [Calypogeia fissa]
MIGGSTQAQQKAFVTLTRLCSQSCKASRELVCVLNVQRDGTRLWKRWRFCPSFPGLDVEQSLKNMLVELRNGGGPGDGRIVFPPTLTARQRRRAHEIAERLGLGHISLGQRSSRCLTAWRMLLASLNVHVQECQYV